MSLGSSNTKGNNHPLRLNYLRMLRLFSYPFGTWPGHILGEKMPGCYRYFIKQSPLQALTILVGEFIYLIGRRKTLTFFTIGDVCITTCLTIVTFIRLLLPNLKRYDDIWKKSLLEFHLRNFKHLGKNFETVSKQVDTVSNFFTLIMIPFIFFGLILFNLSPFLANLSTGAFVASNRENISLRFSISYEYPGFRPEDYFMFTTILNLYLSYACTTVICSLDLFLVLVIFQIIGHIQVLRQNLDDIPLPKNIITFERATKNGRISGTFEKYDFEENSAIHQYLVDCIRHHKYIIDFVEEISGFFGPLMGLVYIYQLFAICLLLMECSQLDSEALARFGPLTIISVMQLIEISVIFEVVGSVSEKLIDNLYFIPWQCMDIKNQRKFYIFFNRIQHPIHVTCMGITPVGVQSMAAIIKTSFSYFTFLRSME